MENSGKTIWQTAETILQWELAGRIPPKDLDGVIPYVINITLSKSSCANDVVDIALVCSATVHDKNGYRSIDVEMTVVIPESSSFLITRILDGKTTTAEPTMPDKVPSDNSFVSKQWFLHHFGTISGGKKDLKLEGCRYLMQDYNNIAKNSIKYLEANTIYTFRFRAVPQHTAHPVFQMRLINLVVGNPSLLEVNAKEEWDEMDSYTLEFSVCSKHYRPGKSTIAVIIPKASCICDTVAYIITLKSGSVCGKSICYVSPVPMTAELRIQKDPKDENGFPHLKDLPIPELCKKHANKPSRAECNCTLAEKISSLSAFSDCTEKLLKSTKGQTRKSKIYVDDAVTFSEKYFIWILAIALLKGSVFAASPR